MKIFAIPYAGGSASIYFKIKKSIKTMEIIPIDLPGHGARFSEKLVTSIQEMARVVYDELIISGIDTPYCLMGYSMGGAVCYELCNIINEKSKTMPRHVFICASEAPHNRKVNETIMTMTDMEITNYIASLGATPKEILDNSELMEIVLPVIKADFTALALYEPTFLSKTIDSILTTIYGSDELNHLDEANQWDEYFRYKNYSFVLEGNHFFLHNQTNAICDIIVDTVEKYKG